LEGFTESFLKEMSPEWNIKGCIIEPGGFDSEWRGSGMEIIPPHQAYTSPTNPCFNFRKIHESHDMSFLGSAVNMAKALYKLADEPTLPLRVQFGSEALFLVRTQALKTAKEADEWAHVAHSTNREGMDGEEYVKMLLSGGNFDRNKE
jgi:hypothetical protein